MAGTSQNRKDEECGAPCTIDAGISVALHICKIAGVPSQDIKDNFVKKKITAQQAFDTIKKRLSGDKFNVGLVEEVEKITKAHLEGKQECVSVIVKFQMEKKLDEMIEDRKEALGTAPAGGRFATGTKQLIVNLKASKDVIDRLPTCEAE